MNTKTKEVVIVGAGLSGPLLAVMLANLGFTVRLYESRQDLRTTDISAGRSINLALSERGILALKHANVMASVQTECIPMQGRMLHLENGGTQFQAYGTRQEEVIYSVSRGELNKLLLQYAEQTERVTTHFEHELKNVDLNAEQLTFGAHGKTIYDNYDLLIGADGYNSKVREAICADNQVAEQPLAHSYKELTLYPDANHQHQLEPNALHIWPRGNYMLIALPNKDGSFTVTLFMPNEGDISFAAINTEAAFTEFFSKHFPDAHALMPKAAEEFFQNPTGKLGTLRVDKWTHNHSVALLGDAAHAIVPFHGQGMNCAFEDCLNLAQLLEVHDHDLDTVLPLYFDSRKKNADAIADMAIENYIEMRNTVRDQKFQLQKALSFELEKRFPDQFIPRYSMVMFHDIPYATAKARGEIIQNILEELTEDIDDLSDVNYALAESLIEKHLQ